MNSRHPVALPRPIRPADLALPPTKPIDITAIVTQHATVAGATDPAQ